MVVAIGNPLLDLAYKLKSDAFLIKHKMKENSQVLVTKAAMEKLKKDIVNFRVESITITPAGSAQNIMRILEWTVRHRKVTVIIGMVGKDEPSELMRLSVINTGLIPRYIINTVEQTGHSLCLVYEHKRTLISHTGAALFITLQDIKRELEDPIMRTVQYVYFCGFLLIGKNLEFSQYLCDYCVQNKKILVFNLASNLVIDLIREAIKLTVGKCQFLFGNYREFEKLKDVLGFEGSIESMCIELSKNNSPTPSNGFGKTVVYTHANKYVFCAHNGGKYKIKIVPHLMPFYMQDTTGCGDAFIAGFLSGLLKNKDLDTCLKWALWTSQQMIQESGVNLPRHASFIDSVLPDA